MVRVLFLAICLFAKFSLFADVALAEKLERQLWEHVKDKKWSDLDPMIAPYFQLALADGSRSKEQFLDIVKTGPIVAFTFSDFTISENSGLLTVTYAANVSQFIGEKEVAAKAVRQSVWRQNSGVWQQVAHAVLSPPNDHGFKIFVFSGEE